MTVGITLRVVCLFVYVSLAVRCAAVSVNCVGEAARNEEITYRVLTWAAFALHFTSG